MLTRIENEMFKKEFQEQANTKGELILATIEEVKEELASNDRLSDKAIDFFDGVEERTQSIIDYANEEDGATEKQMLALNNMLDGVNKWTRED